MTKSTCVPATAELSFHFPQAVQLTFVLVSELYTFRLGSRVDLVGICHVSCCSLGLGATVLAGVQLISANGRRGDDGDG